MKIKILLCGFLCILMVVVHGQQENEGINYNLAQFPPSPSASMMARFDEYPVNKSTGLPEISIPLFTINEGGISLPISINYHASGIKVQDDPSIVGLGWTLSYGGSISRTVRGLKDDYSNGYLKSVTRVPSYNSIIYGLYNDNLFEQTHILLQQIVQQQREFEPDLFSYNYGNKSGSFMFGNDIRIYTIPYDGSTIEPLFKVEGYGHSIKGFNATDDLGIQYFFGNIIDDGYIETTVVDNWQSPPPLPYESAWLLSRISNPFSKTDISFEYTDNQGGVTETRTESKYYTLQAGGWDAGEYSSDFMMSYHNTRTISKINLNNRTLEFYYSTYNYNNIMYKKLDQIVYKENVTSGAQMYADFGYTTYSDGRLKLDTVTLSSNQDENEQVYLIEYDQRDLPPYNSLSIDHWGYYNGSDNIGLLPYVPFGNNIMLGSGADRSPNPEYTSVGTLKKITFPTGGYKEYTFEQNSFERKKTIEDISMQESSVSVSANYSNSINSINLNEAFADLIENNLILPGSFTILGELNPHHECGENVQTDESGLINLKRNGEVILEIDLYRNPTATGECKLEDEVITTLDFYANQYTLEAIANNSLTNTVITGSFIYEYYNEDELDLTVIDYGGGQRIKKIENFDNVTGEFSIRNYTYDGYLTSFSKPKYHSMSWTKSSEHYGCEDAITHVTINSTASSGLGSSSNSVAYSRVSEYFGTLEENTGRIDTYFIKATDDHTGHGPPFFPRNSYQWKRSIPTKEVVIGSIGASHVDTVKLTEYYYEIIPDLDFKIRVFKASRKYSYNCAQILTEDLRNEFYYDHYDYRIENIHIKDKITTDYYYENNDKQKVVNNQNFNYENPLSQKPTSIFTTNSKNQEIRIEENYPSSSIIYDCYEPCMATYKADLESCDMLEHKALLELSECNILYGQYWDALMGCWWECEQIPQFPFISCTYMDMSYKEITECRENTMPLYNLYIDCLNDLGFSYMACYNGVISNYRNCNAGVNLCIYNKIENSNNDIDKAKYTLALFDIKNLLLEKKVIINEQVSDHHKWNYKLFNPSDLDNVPLLHSIDKYIDGALNVREVEVKEYDERNNIVEILYKENLPYNSFKWGNSHQHPIVGIENAQYDEVFYEGFEEHPYGLPFIHNGIHLSKTGSKALINGSFNIPDSFVPPDDAVLSYWYFMSDKWNYFEGQFTYNINCGGTHIDEIRVYPKEALLTTYAYDTFGKLISSTDPNNITAYYEYDGLGRLVTVRDNDCNIIQQYEYNYATGDE